MKKKVPLIKSKFLKTTVLLREEALKEYVPETRRLSAESLLELLRCYGMVYIKPDKGRYGGGIMRAEMLSGPHNTVFRLSLGRVSRQYTSYEELQVAVESITAFRPYLVQQGIQMLTHDNCLFDVRVMVQQSPRRKWETTGYLARVAAPGRIVTNFHSEGTPHELPPILANYLSSTDSKRLIQRLCRLGVTVAKRCHRAFPQLKEVGLDIAIDRGMKPWILEVNTRPMADVFMKLGNKTMFRRITRYARLY